MTVVESDMFMTWAVFSLPFSLETRRDVFLFSQNARILF